MKAYGVLMTLLGCSLLAGGVGMLIYGGLADAFAVQIGGLVMVISAFGSLMEVRCLKMEMRIKDLEAQLTAH